MTRTDETERTVTLTERELTLVRAALFQRIGRLAHIAHMQASYDESRALMQGKLRPMGFPELPAGDYTRGHTT